MLGVWRKYFVSPAVYAPAYTKWSRNFLNLGIMALMVSWFFAGGAMNARFAFSDMTDQQVHSLKRVEGEWLYIGGRNPKGEGIVVPGTDSFLAMVDMGLPSRTGPQFYRKPAIGYVHPDAGMVQMDVAGERVLTFSETQAYWQLMAYRFFGLVIFAVLMFGVAISRQIYLVKLNGKQ